MTMPEFTRRLVNAYYAIEGGMYRDEIPWGLARWFIREWDQQAEPPSPSTVGRWIRGEVSPYDTPLGMWAMEVLYSLEARGREAKVERLKRAAQDAQRLADELARMP